MTDWSKNALAVDLAYCNIISDYAQFRQNGVEIAFIKLCQGASYYDKLFDTHWHKTGGAGMIRGAYHLFDPRATPLQQLNWIKSHYPAIEADLPITLECEDLPGVDMSDYSHQYLIKQVGNLWGLLTREYGKKPILYTGSWWWNIHMVPAASWIKDADFWLANRPFASGAVDTTWDGFKTEWLPRIKNWVKPVNGGPEAIWWQVTGDKFRLPGVNGAINIDLFNGTLADCIERYGIVREKDDYKDEPLDYPTYFSFATPFLNIRCGPGKEFLDIGDLYPDIVVTGYDEKDNWVRIDPTMEKWVYKPYLRKYESV